MEFPRTARAVIAFVSNNCWSLYNFRMHLLRHYVALGHRVVAIAAADEYTEQVKAAGVVYYDVGFRNNSVDPLSDLRVYRQLKEIYGKERPSIIFHFVLKPSIYGSFAAGRHGIPAISIISGLGYVYSGNNWLSTPVSFLLRRALRHSREVWFLNRENAGFFTGKRIIPPGKSKVIPGEGIDTNWFVPREAANGGSTFVFLMTSRLLWSKGVGTYMEAARILRQQGYQAQFRLLGKPEAQHPESIPPARLRSWEEEGLLVNLGSSDDVRDALAAADCFVLPTYYEEGIPRTLLEACSMEIPAITSDHTGCNSVIEDGVNGLLCKPRDVQDLARNMVRMMNMLPRQRRDMGRNGREKMIRQFSNEHVIRYYDDAIARYTAQG